MCYLAKSFVCYSRNLTESVTVLLEEGAVVMTPSLLAAAIYGNFSFFRALATIPGVKCDVLVSMGCAFAHHRLSTIIGIVYRI